MIQIMFALDGPIESQEQLVSVSKMVTNYLKSTVFFNSQYLIFQIQCPCVYKHPYGILNSTNK